MPKPRLTPIRGQKSSQSLPSAIREPLESPPPGWIPSRTFFRLVNWVDGSPLRIEPYRQQIFSSALDVFQDNRLRYNLILCGRGKKNFKTSDLVLAALFALLANDSPSGNEVMIVANDEDQAGDDLDLTKKIVRASPHLAARLKIQSTRIDRKDDKGELTILPAQDVKGSHGKSYRFLGIDELHAARDWSLLEALALDPTRADSQQWIASYDSLYHKVGSPLYDLLMMAQRGDDPRMFASWYSGGWCTDPSVADLSPEEKANPSRASFGPGYLEQQKRRLPSARYRRLHLNIGGSPEGAAFPAEVILDLIPRGVRQRPVLPVIPYWAFVDPSGGSHDSFTLGISHLDPDGQAILDLVMDQGQQPPFDPTKAVTRFVEVLKRFGITTVYGDRYSGLTFQHLFEAHGIGYEVSAASASDLYQGIEPRFNAKQVSLLDHPELESQLLGLVWRGGKVDHLPSEFDDLANAAVGSLMVAVEFGAGIIDVEPSEDEQAQLAQIAQHWGVTEVTAER